ncbi:hypothetical protein AHAS_Ahas12G0062800 [Arachis hypogaea]
MRAILLGFLTLSLLSVLSLHLERTALSNCPSALVLGLIKMKMMMLQTLMMILIFNRVIIFSLYCFSLYCSLHILFLICMS